MNTDRLTPELRSVYYSFSETFLNSLLRFQQDKAPKGPRLDPHTLLRDLAMGSLRDENRECCEEAARRDGMPFDAKRPYVAFRDLTVSNAAQAGFLVGTETQSEAVDILRPWSVTAKAGIQIEMGLQGNQLVPKTTVKSTAHWLSTEATGVTASQTTLGQVALTPKTVGIVIQFSRQFATQTNAAAFVGRELLRTVGTAIDAAIIGGTAVVGQPQGISGTVGVQMMAGASLTGASANQMKALCAGQNAPDDQISYLGTPTVRLTLENRERATGSGFIWDRDQVSSRPAYVSTDVPAGALFCGAWSTVYLGIWGAGFVVAINPFEITNFRSGVVQARLLLSCDVGLLQASSFVIATNVT